MKQIPIDYEEAEMLKEHLHDDVWNEYIRIHDKYHEQRCTSNVSDYLDLEAEDENEEEEVEAEDDRPNEMDLNDPFINDGELDFDDSAAVSAVRNSTEEKKKRILSRLEKKKREVERLEKRLKNL